MLRVTLNYSEGIVKESVKAFWWKQLGLSYIVALSIIAIIVFYLIAVSGRSIFVGILGGILLVGLTVFVGSYFLFYYRSMHRLNKLGKRNAILEISQDFFRVTSDLGSSEIKWSLITKIQKLKNCWIIYFSESETMTWPITDLEPETLDEIHSIIKDKNIKLV